MKAVKHKYQPKYMTYKISTRAQLHTYIISCSLMFVKSKMRSVCIDQYFYLYISGLTISMMVQMNSVMPQFNELLDNVISFLINELIDRLSPIFNEHHHIVGDSFTLYHNLLCCQLSTIIYNTVMFYSSPCVSPPVQRHRNRRQCFNNQRSKQLENSNLFASYNYFK